MTSSREPIDGAPLTPEMFREAVPVSRETHERLRIFADCLARWQARINLVSAASIDDLWRRHMLDSAQLAEAIPAEAQIITDLGSGAGFPGLVLAIMLGRETHLVEADNRKAAFLREAARLTETSVVIHAERIEALIPWPSAVLTARALAPLPRLIGLAFPFLRISPALAPRCVFPKGGNWHEELTAARKLWNMRAEALESRTDPAGRVIILRDVAPKGPLVDEAPATP